MKFFFIIIVVLMSFTAHASEDYNTPEENSRHHTYHNHIALFLGSTTYYKNNKSFFSIGLDYLYRPNKDNPWAYSVIGEVIFADHIEYVIAFPIYHYLINEWWMRAGPGFEIIEEEDNHEENSSSSEIEFLFRIGTGYSFHVGKFVISPSVDIDFVRNNHALVWGINIGYSF